MRGISFSVLLFMVCFSPHESLAKQQGADVPIRLSIKEALRRADEISVEVVLAQLRVKEAIAQLERAQGALLPQVSGHVGGARQSRDLRATGFPIASVEPHIGPFNSFDARGKVTLSLFDLAAINRLKQIQKMNALSKLEYQKSRQDALALVATFYIQAKRAIEHVLPARSAFKRDAMRYQITKQEYKDGMNSLLALKRARSAMQESFFEYRKCIDEARERRMDLAAALKLPLDRLIIFNDDSLSDTNLDAYFDEDDLVDVKVAAERVRIKESEKAVAQGKMLPTVQAAADYGRAGKTPDRGSNTFTVGLEANVPIWLGGMQQAEVKEASATLDIAKEQLSDTRIKTTLDIKMIRLQVEQMQQLIASKKSALYAADEAVRVALAQKRNDLGSEWDVLDASAQSSLALDQLREAQAGYWMARINLAHALGRVHDLI